MIGLKESFRLIYSNTHLRTRETLPLMKDMAEQGITILQNDKLIIDTNQSLN